MATTLARIQLLQKLGSDWASSNPILLAGEIGIADVGSSTPIIKAGDGSRHWADLPQLNAAVPPANDYVAGVTTTLPPGADATVTIDNISDPPTISIGVPAGDTGPANELTIGTVTTGAPGSPAAATITGTPPAQILNLTLPAGAQGPQGIVGPAGPANTLTIGTVTEGPAAATITGTAPNQTLNLVLPPGPVGPQGIQGIQGPPGSAALAGPSALIGLTAINGSSGFALRADAAPALSQAITPTWTGLHTFAASPVTIRGNANDVTNSAYLAITRLDNTLLGYFGDGSAGNNDIVVVAANTLRLYAGNVERIKVDPVNPITTFITAGGGSLAIIGDRGGAGSAVFYGTNSNTHFMFGATEDVYIRPGKAGSTVNINEYGSGVTRIGLDAASTANIYGVVSAMNDDLRSNFIYCRTTPTKYIYFVPAYGTISVTGTNGGFAGYAINAANQAVFGDDGANSTGIYINIDGGKSLIVRNSSTTAISSYNLSAPSFNATSARALKRETGRPHRARDILARLRPILYRLLADDTREQIGLIAEEVHEACPQLSDGKTVAYDRLALLLLADWQESRGVA